LSELDRGVLVRAVALILGLLVPPVVVIRTILGPDSDSPLWNLIVLAYLVSFVVGGAYAAKAASQAPVKHAAAAGAGAFGVALVVGLLRNLLTGWSLGLAGFVTALLLWQIATSLALVGGLLGRRRRPQEVTTG
jgi:hypothetical protein